MTEAEWRVSASPEQMLRRLGAAASSRKVRLFACAWAFDVWHLLTDPRSQDAVLVAEEFADGQTDEVALRAAHTGAAAARAEIDLVPRGGRRVGEKQLRRGNWAARCAATVARVAADPALSVHELNACLEDENLTSRWAAADRVRDLFDNLFRPAAFNPRWLTDDVVGLARAIYEDRAFDRLPLLADALMDAGCEDEDVLVHCRSAGPHVRGCWVVDLALGK